MSSVAPGRPRRKNANVKPAAILLADKRPRRSSAQVAQDKVELEAKRQAILKKREEDLRELAALERQLKEQDQEDAMEAAHPMVTSDTMIDPVLFTVPQTPVTTEKGQSGRIKRLTRDDLNTYRQSESNVTPPAPSDMPTNMASKENTVSKPLSMPTGQKRKSNGSEEGRVGSTKKGKAGKPGGATAAAAAKFSTPRSGRSTVTPTANPDIDATAPQDVQGVYTQSFGGIELDDPFSINNERAQLASQSTLADNIAIMPAKMLQLEVVNVADIPASPAKTPAHQLPQQPLFTPQHVQPQPTVKNNQYTMRHLEPILGPYIGNYNIIFIPKLINLVGNHANGPWKLYGLDLVGAMRNLATEVWPGLVMDIVPRQPFFEMSKQKLSEYRNQMANEAIEVVSGYLQSRRFDTAADRAEYVTWALQDTENLSFPFRFAVVEQEKDGSYSTYGAYQGTLISRTLAYHIRRIAMRTDQIRDSPCNALALATTAVERALGMWKSGSLQRPRGRSEEAKFSDRLWGRTSAEYMVSIIDISDEQWDKILTKAELCARGLDEDSDEDIEEDTGYNDSSHTSGRARIEDAAVLPGGMLGQ